MMSRRVLWALVASLVAGTVIVLAQAGIRSRDEGSRRADRLTAAIRQALTLKARAAIEGGASSYLGGGLACAVQLLGTAPPAVTQADQAQTAYVWVMCAVVGGPTESSLPLAVHFTDPPVAEAPGDGSRNGPDQKRIFPERLWGLVSEGPDNIAALDDEMKRRRRELEGGAPQATPT